MAKPQEKVSFRERLKQIGMVFKFTAKQDKWFAPLAAAAVLIPLALTVPAVIYWGWLWLPLGILLALLALLIVLNMRSTKAMMNAAEGQPGAAASILENMRGDWRVTPAISSTTQMDMVHLVVGRPGVILLAEGSPQRVRHLLGQEKRRLAKVIGTAPLYDYVIGREEGEVPLPQAADDPGQAAARPQAPDVTALNRRLKALSARPQMPKGAIPKNMRPQKAPRMPRR